MPQRCWRCHAPLSREIERDNGSWYLRRILPYRSDDADRGRGHHLRRHFRAESWRNAKSKPRTPIPTASSRPFASRLWFSMTTFGSFPPVELFHETFGAKREDAVGQTVLAARAPCTSTIPVCAYSSIASRPGEGNIEDYEIELDLPPLPGRRSLLAGGPRAATGPSAGRKILVTIDDITERKRESEALEVAKSAGGTGQSRKVALSGRRQSRFAPAAANPQPSARDIGEVDQGRRRLGADPQARRAARGHVGHVEHAARHQPAGSRNRQPGDRGLSDRCLLERLRPNSPITRQTNGSTGAWSRAAHRAERSAAARADDPQSLVECREIHAARQDPARLPPARRQAPARSLGHRHGHPGTGSPGDLRRIPSGRQSRPRARPGPWPRSRHRAAHRTCSDTRSTFVPVWARARSLPSRCRLRARSGGSGSEPGRDAREHAVAAARS